MADWLTLVPALVAIIVVLWRKEVILALLLSQELVLEILVGVVTLPEKRCALIVFIVFNLRPEKR